MLLQTSAMSSFNREARREMLCQKAPGPSTNLVIVAVESAAGRILQGYWTSYDMQNLPLCCSMQETYRQLKLPYVFFICSFKELSQNIELQGCCTSFSSMFS